MNKIPESEHENQGVPEGVCACVHSCVPVLLSSCSPKEITGIAEAKNMYVVGARILYKTTTK
jgi:hypothetical protein